MVLYSSPPNYDLSYMINERQRLLEQIRALRKQIVIWEFQPYQRYFDLHKDEYELLDDTDEEDQSPPRQNSNRKSDRGVTGSVIPGEGIRNPRRVAAKDIRSPVGIARRNPKRLRAGRRFGNMSLDEKVVKRVRHPFRRSDWVLKPQDRFQPEVVDTFDLVFKPVSFRFLLSNPRIKAMIGRLTSK